MRNGILIVAFIISLTNLLNAKHYKCYKYINGKPTGTWIKVEASSKDDASTKSYLRYKELGSRVDSVNCHFISK